MDLANRTVAWRSASMESGAQSATTSGVTEMLVLCVANWDSPMQVLHKIRILCLVV